MKNFFANNIQNYVGVPVGPGSTVVLTLSQDAVTLVGNVIAETIYVIPIDATGSFSQSIWFNDELNPSGTFYRIAIKVPGVGTVYSQSVPITGASFNLASFVPGTQGTAMGVVLPVFETNGTPNADQSLLNLIPGANISITSDDDGDVTIAGAAGGGVTSVFTRTGAVVAVAGDYAVAQITGAAPLANPALTGVPTAPTAAPLANSTQLATTAYDDAAVGVEKTRAQNAEALLAPLASPVLSGTPTAPTPTSGDDSTKIATTAFVENAINNLVAGDIPNIAESQVTNLVSDLAAETQTIASGTATLGTTAIASGAKASIVTVSAPGVLTTDTVAADFNTDPSGTTGYAPSANGMLTIIKWCTADNVNFYVYNNTGASVTPGAMTLNWRVTR